ncbi:hypothetical protein JCM19992_20540 [Thermostilla marina]
MADRILPNLFIGPYIAMPGEIDQLVARHQIDAILNLQTDRDLIDRGVDIESIRRRCRELGVELVRVPIRDFDVDDLTCKLPEAASALAELLRRGKTVYLHCTAGINRSATVAIAYLYWFEDQDLAEAIETVMSRHLCEPYIDAIRRARNPVDDPPSET